MKKTYWVDDISEMHSKFFVNAVIQNMTQKQLHLYLKFRLDMIQEEVDEAKTAFEQGDSDGIVDSLIDAIVFAIGTLDAFNVDAYEAWNRVHQANMAKSPGIKESRPNPFGFPDLIKPEGWESPDHKDNVGLLLKAFNNK